MKTQHHPSETRTFFKGANVDLSLELFVAGLEGQYLDAFNMRPSSAKGNKGGAEKISGEELLYEAGDTSCVAVYGGGALPNGFENMASMEINYHIVEFWANRNPVIPPFIRIDGIIVASHPDLPLRTAFPIQVDKNENCVGGEFFSTDHDTPPILLNVKDLLINGGVDVGDEEGDCSEKYFGDFEINRWTVNLDVQLDQMRFIALDQGNIGVYDVVYGANGLVGGSYQYTFRYVTADGDRTRMAPITPTIPVPRVFSATSTAYPYSRTFGTDIGEDTGNGIHLRFRITNTLDYDYVEIIRIPFNAGEALNFSPAPEIIGVFDIPNNTELMVVNILDYGPDPESIEPMEEDEITNLMAGVQAAKSLRYFGRRLELFNVTYASRDTLNTITFKDPVTPMFPVTAHLGKAGHADPWNTTYRRSRQHDEYYGNGLVLWDAFGNYTFAQDIVGFENHRMPQNKAPMPQDNQNNSLGVVPTPTMDMTGTLSVCYDFFDMHDAVYKDSGCELKHFCGTEHDMGTNGEQRAFAFANIGFPIPGTLLNEIQGGTNTLPGWLNCDNVGGEANWLIIPAGGPPAVCSWYLGTIKRAHEIPYSVFHPINEFDTNNGLAESDHNYPPNVRVLTDGGVPHQDYTEEFKPEGFSPDYFSLGMAFKGLETWPDWAVGFSLVRTPPAGRVVAEGMSMYKINPALFDTNGFGSIYGVSKEKYELWTHFTDIDTGLSEGDVIADVNANPHLYAVQLFQPVGFFSEHWNNLWWCNTAASRHRKLDIAVYPRIHHDIGQINAGEGNIGFNGHVGFGKWRNDSQPPWTNQNGIPGNVEPVPGSRLLYEFDLNSGAISTEVDGTRAGSLESGVSRYKITLPLAQQRIYDNATIGGGGQDGRHFDNEVKNWHEPFYMIRIVRKNRSIDTSPNIRQFHDTGHFQKFSSIIGKGDSTLNQSFELVDERWEDCCPDLDGGTIYYNRDAFVYLRDDSLSERAWLNVTNMSQVVIDALNATITADGFVVHNGIEVYGLFTHENTTDGRWVNLKFDYQVVPDDTYVIVRYDNTIPIRNFDGDKTVGENVFSPIDRECGSFPQDVGDQFTMNVGFPYYTVQMNSRHLIARKTFHNTQGPGGLTVNEEIQEANALQTDWMRQMLVMYPTLTRTHLGYPHERRRTEDEVVANIPREGFFPATHYIMRPNRWLPGGAPTSRPGADARHNWAGRGYGLDFPGHVLDPYFDDYPGEGTDEDNSGIWKWGGFRYEKLTNIDYSKVGQFRKFATRPSVGFVEQTKFCTRIIWSLPRDINVQDEPGLRTFYATNAYDIDDRQGEIKMGWSANSEKGDNLYAITDSGTCLLITDKRIISDLNATELMLAGTGDESYIAGEYWLSKNTGMNDEMYRSATEMDDALYFVNFESAYMFHNNALVNLGKIDYHYRVRTDYIEQVAAGYLTKIMSVYDTLHEEVWFGISDNCIHVELGPRENYEIFLNTDPYSAHIVVTESMGPGQEGTVQLPTASGSNWESDRICVSNLSENPITVIYPVALIVQEFVLEPGEASCFTRDAEITQGAAYIGTTINAGCANEALVYATKHEKWVGKYGYRFDKYLSFDNKTYGFRDGETYELNKGEIIDGEEIVSYVEQVFNPLPGKDKEFIRVRASTTKDVKPTSIVFFDEFDGTEICRLDAASFGQFYLKDYHGWEQLIPSKVLPPNDRVQGRNIIVRVVHEGPGDFVLNLLEVQYKPLK
jgi:hypothetical protein